MDLVRRLLKLIATFVATVSPLWVGVVMALGGGAGFFGMVTYNQASSFCMKCHEPQGVFTSFDAEHTSHKPYKESGEACLTCHTDKNFYNIAGNWAASLPEKLVRSTNAEAAKLPELDPGYTDQQCLACHFDVLKLRDAEKLELPEKVAAIGLRFSHQRHFWVKSFPEDAEARLGELTEAQADGEENDEAKSERELLLKAKLGWCGQCHDRRQGGEVERSINYFAFNPMRCTGCHTDAVRGRHPGTVHLALPSEETCRRCHTGTFHGRFTIFRAECEGADKRDCSQCHPDYRENAANAAY
ncbi:MAG: hypothetical protein P9L99_00785 [Candidatus Lernaella stagnicola]|nr:hypothetical protein [Candidatus Lernaella stagnicola]